MKIYIHRYRSMHACLRHVHTCMYLHVHDHRKKINTFKYQHIHTHMNELKLQMCTIKVLIHAGNTHTQCRHEPLSVPGPFLMLCLV